MLRELSTSIARTCDKCRTIVRHLSKVPEAPIRHFFYMVLGRQNGCCQPSCRISLGYMPYCCLKQVVKYDGVAKPTL